MHKIRQKMAESNRGGRAVVVDKAGRLRGIITRTDLLRQVHASVAIIWRRSLRVKFVLPQRELYVCMGRAFLAN